MPPTGSTPFAGVSRVVLAGPSLSRARTGSWSLIRSRKPSGGVTSRSWNRSIAPSARRYWTCPRTTGGGPSRREATQRDDDLGDRIPRRLPRGADPVAEAASGREVRGPRPVGSTGSSAEFLRDRRQPAEGRDPRRGVRTPLVSAGRTRRSHHGGSQPTGEALSPVSSRLTSQSLRAAASSCAAAEVFTGFCLAKYLPVTPSTSGELAR